MKTASKRLAWKLVDAREKAGLKQIDVSNTGIVSQSELSKIENNQRVIPFILVVKLAELYEVELKDLAQ